MQPVSGIKLNKPTAQRISAGERQRLNFMRKFILVLFSWFFLVPASLAQDATIHHNLKVKLLPDTRSITVVDEITLPENLTGSLEFSLLGTLTPSITPGTLVPLPRANGQRFQHYRIEGLDNNNSISLEYRGKIQITETRAEHGMPTAMLSKEGVYLDGASGWYPWFGGKQKTFRLTVEAPEAWEVISQGKRQKTKEHWQFDTATPQDDIYLLAGSFTRFTRAHKGWELAVYLLEADAELAEHYLEPMASYLEFYSELIGNYPYPGFAVVENRWQTGYGMPSFTLLGSRVIRLPFIPHTSLPHEILHNWWGNGVWVDYQRGNWSEGLTAYLADHLLKENDAADPEYRRKALERYADYAAANQDFPLLQFRSRHNQASQAVGYGKSLMWFHMLRRELGDDLFLNAIRSLWQQWQYRPAGFMDVLAVFREVSGRKLDGYEQLLHSSGAPVLRLKNQQVIQRGDKFELSLQVAQVQNAPVFSFPLTIAVTLQDSATARLFQVPIEEKLHIFRWTFDKPPLRLDIDPYYDVFRLLDLTERPSTLSRLFGAQRQRLILPMKASDDEKQGWFSLVELWSQKYGNLDWNWDTEIQHLPEDQPVWILGWQNSWLQKAAERLNDRQQVLQADGVIINGRRYDKQASAVVLLDPDNRRPPLGFLAASNEQIIPRMAGKLTHYGSFGRLIFDNSDASNKLRERLPVRQSSLSAEFEPGIPLELPARPGLSALTDRE